MATHSYLGILQVDASGSGAWGDVGQCIKITPPKIKVTASKTTHLASTQATDTFIPGFITPGEVQVELNMTSAMIVQMLSYIRVMKNWRVRYNDGTTPTSGSVWTFAGFWTEFGDEVPENDRITTTMTVTVSGPETFVAGT